MFISFFHCSRNIVAVNIILLLKPRLDFNGGFGFSTSNLSLSLSFCKQVLSISLIKTEILADSKHKSRKKSWG